MTNATLEIPPEFSCGPRVSALRVGMGGRYPEGVFAIRAGAKSTFLLVWSHIGCLGLVVRDAWLVASEEEILDLATARCEHRQRKSCPWYRFCLNDL